MIHITKQQARALAETLERAPKSARYAMEQKPGGAIILWDREPGDFRIRISRNGTVHPRPASAALREFESQ